MYFCVHHFLYYLFAVYSKYLPTLCKGRYDSQAKKNQIYVTLTKFMTKIISYIFFLKWIFQIHTHTHTHTEKQKMNNAICKYVFVDMLRLSKKKSYFLSDKAISTEEAVREIKRL